MDRTTRLYLVRHGEVDAQYHRIFGGRIDMELSPFGHEQARVVSDYLQAAPLDAIYVSPMKRAQLTAIPVAARRRQVPITLPELQEVDFGVWTGLGWEEVSERFKVSAFDWLMHLEQGTIPEAEPAQQFRDRIESCLRQILGEAAGRTAAVVCHGGVVRMMLSILLDLPLSKTAGFEIDYASLTVVDCRPRKTEVQLLNFTPWRPVI